MKIPLKILTPFTFAFIMLGTVVQCSTDAEIDTVDETENSNDEDTITATNVAFEDYIINTAADTIDDEIIVLAESHEVAEDYTWDSSSALDITLNGNSITTSAEGVTIEGTTATISIAATYRITGNLTDGQIIVDTDDDTAVKLVLNGIDITSSTSAPLAILNAEKTIIILADDTDNYLTDSASYIYATADIDEPDAALFSDDDLTIYGAGMLTVDGNYNEAIKSKDGLIIKDATITITSVDDGIQGKDYLIIDGGNYDITVDGDGLKSSNDEDTTLGYIQLDAGAFNIVSGSDAIQAETNLLVYGGEFTLQSGGGSSATLSEDDSAKGLKGGTSVVIAENPIFNIDAADDGVHSNTKIAIYGGIFNIATGDDGVHSDGELNINGGSILITESYEGIEGAIINMNAGEIRLTSSDDGMNAAGDTGNFSININGGFVLINASGDGIDANGDITMTHGMVIVNGPAVGANGTLDYDGTFKISGGFLLAVGRLNMLQAPSSNSSQNSIQASLNSSQSAGTLIHLQNADNTTLFTFAPIKNFQSVVFSSPDLVAGSSCNFYLGGSSTGSNNDGLFEDGIYTSESLYKTFIVSDGVTIL